MCSDLSCGVARPDDALDVLEGVLAGARLGDADCRWMLRAVEVLDSVGRAWPSEDSCADVSKACCGSDSRLFSSALGVATWEPD